MPSSKIDIDKIQRLITSYASTNGIDNDCEILSKIVDNIKTNGYILFKETALLSSILGVSPDYITGISSQKEYDKDILNILYAIYSLNDNFKRMLSESALKYLDIQNNIMDFKIADIDVITYNERGEIIKTESSDEDCQFLMASDSSIEYNDKDQ